MNSRISIPWPAFLIIIGASIFLGYFLHRPPGNEQWDVEKQQLLKQNAELSRMAVSLDSSYRMLDSAKTLAEKRYNEVLRRSTNRDAAYLAALHEAHSLPDSAKLRYLTTIIDLGAVDTLARLAHR